MIVRPLLFVALVASTSLAQTYRARVAMEHPERHFFQVELALDGYTESSLELVLPTWTPGSYKIRDYSRNLESFTVTTPDGAPVPFEKVSKNVWRVSNPGAVRVRYEAFAYEASVRTSWLDDEQGFLMPGSVIPYVNGRKHEPVVLEVEPPPSWRIDTTLEQLGPGRFRAHDYDRLVDCPVQIGTQEVHEFEVNGTTFGLVLTGAHDMDVPAMLGDLARVVDESGAIFGGFPFERYLFLTRFGRGGGGLEHADSTALMSGGFRFSSKQGWQSFLGLCAHEFFHVWNVKRIRDEALGPFDYTREIYTRLLWFHEGFTSYYADQLLRRAGILDEKELLGRFERVIRGYYARPGRTVQSLAESSFDAWIKHYQTNETSRNSTVSYYGHGQAVALCFDLIVRDESEGQRSLDDVFRQLFEGHARFDQNISEEVLRQALVEAGGPRAERFWKDHVVDTVEIDFAHWMSLAGLELERVDERALRADAENAEDPEREANASAGTNENAPSATGESGAVVEPESSEPAAGNGAAVAEEVNPWDREPLPDLGFSTRTEGPSLVVTAVERDGSAWEAGLALGDELVAVGRRRIVPAHWEPLLRKHLAEGTLRLTIARGGRLLDIDLPLDAPRWSWKLRIKDERSERERAVYHGLFDVEEAPAESADDS